MKRFDLAVGLTALVLMIGMSYVTYDLLSGSSSDPSHPSGQSPASRTSGSLPASASSLSPSPGTVLTHTDTRGKGWPSKPQVGEAKPMLIATTANLEAEPVPTPTPIASDTRPDKDTAPNAPPSLDPVYFHFDRAGFSDEARATLDRHAAWLLQEPEWSVLIQGHTDQEGSVESNLRVGRRRAESVRRYLIDKGVAADRLHIVSLGEFAPVCTEDTAECRERNRRVSFAIAPRDLTDSPAHTASVQESTEQTMQRDLTPSPTNALSSENVEEEAITTIESSPSAEISESAHTRELGHTAADQHAQAGAFPTESLEAGLSPTSSSDRPFPEAQQSMAHMADQESPQESEDQTP